MDIIPKSDAYLLARFLANKEWSDLPGSPAIKALANSLSKAPDKAQQIEKLLGREWMASIYECNPDEPLIKSPTNAIPDLPKSARLTKAAKSEAGSVGQWLTDATEWGVKRSPMTPRIFIEAGFIWALGLAIARRAYLHLHAPIFPHLYVLWVARTSLFKKSTGMQAVSDLINEAIPHLLMAQEYSPESFISALAGQASENYEKLSAYEQALEDKARRYAGRGGILLDEASSLLGAKRKDYMQGQAEMLMRLYDAPPRYARDLRSQGKMVINYPALSILGATTPASMARNIGDEDWETGELARFALLFPEKAEDFTTDTLTPQEYKPPANLVQRLQKLHSALPAPIAESALNTGESPEPKSIHVTISPEAHAAYTALYTAYTYTMPKAVTVNETLEPNYARMHIQCVKIAISIACIDWADSGANGNPHISLAVWARAQSIVEEWRASCHRLIAAVNESADARAEKKLLYYLGLYPDSGMTMRELTQQTGLTRVSLKSAIESLIESGEIIESKRKGKRGPEATVYLIPQSENQ